MPVAVAEALVALSAAYVGAGAIFATAFVAWGASRVDVRAAGASWGFRLLILPGAALLWPWLAGRWIRHWRMRP